MTDWSAAERRVTDALMRRGGNATISRQARGTVEPVPGEIVTRGELSPARTATFKAALYRDTDDLDAYGSVHDQTRILLVAPGAFEPAASDTVSFGGVTMTVEAVETVRPDGQTAVLHRCRVMV